MKTFWKGAEGKYHPRRTLSQHNELHAFYTKKRRHTFKNSAPPPHPPLGVWLGKDFTFYILLTSICYYCIMDSYWAKWAPRTPVQSLSLPCLSFSQVFLFVTVNTIFVESADISTTTLLSIGNAVLLFFFSSTQHLFKSLTVTKDLLTFVKKLCCNTGWSQKVSHHQLKNRIKTANKIRFLRKVKYKSSAIIQSVGNKYSVRDLLLWRQQRCPARKVAICVTCSKWCQRSLWHQLALASCKFHSKIFF